MYMCKQSRGYVCIYIKIHANWCQYQTKIIWYKLWYPSKHLLVLKMSSRRLQRNNFKSSNVTILLLPSYVLENKKLLHWRRLQDILKICLEEVLKTCYEDVLKTCLEDVLKTLWRQIKYLLGISVSNKSIFHKSISDISKANPKCIN